MLVLTETHLHDHSGFWSEYWSILSDPAHLAAEVTFTLIDILFLSPLLFLAWRGLKSYWSSSINKAVMREHHAIDAEHGLEAHNHPGHENC